MIKQSELKELLKYNSKTGEFTWLKSLNGRIKAGDIAGSLENNGYIRISVNRRRYTAHRLAFIYIGREVPYEIDHIDGDRKNNRLSNLRLVNRAENCRNRKKSKRNSSGVTGVSFNKKLNKWRADIGDKGNLLYIGSFDLFDDAVAARKDAEEELGYFEGHGER